MTRMSIHELSAEYISWTKKYGNGRNENGLRFGQHICNMTGESDPVVYNKENASQAYMMLLDIFAFANK